MFIISDDQEIEPKSSRQKIGKEGEAQAAKFLLSKGYMIIGRNIRIGRDEIDIIARDKKDDVIVFCEVKTLSKSGGAFNPVFNFNRDKKYCSVRAAYKWMNRNDYSDAFRIDLVCVCGDRVTEHYKNVTF